MRPIITSLLLVTLVAVAAHAAISKGYAGWNDDPSTQYHIQTDEGPERYFRYQTTSGQYRKEKRLEDGTVIGTYGWVDPTGYLDLKDYIADNAGYRIVRTKRVFVGLNSDDTPVVKTSTPVVSAPKIDVITVTPTPAPVVKIVPIKVYHTSNLYDHASSNPVKPAAANFNSHPYYQQDEYEPVIGYQKKPVNSINALYQKQNYQTAYQTPAVYQPSQNYQYKYKKPLQTVRVYTPQQQAFQDEQQRVNSQQQSSQQYDGVSTTQNGFRYYLPKHYHEEESNANNDRSGSYGYIDPFGIRRVVYYNTSPGSGFQVKKNNRYVGFDSTPYDPRF